MVMGQVQGQAKVMVRPWSGSAGPWPGTAESELCQLDTATAAT